MSSNPSTPIRVLSAGNEPILLSTRQRILEHENFVVHSLEDANQIPSSTETNGSFDLAILGHTFDVAQIKAAAGWLRAHQPSTKLLLLGVNARDLDPSQFDEFVNPADGPLWFLTADKAHHEATI